MQSGIDTGKRRSRHRRDLPRRSFRGFRGLKGETRAPSRFCRPTGLGGFFYCDPRTALSLRRAQGRLYWANFRRSLRELHPGGMRAGRIVVFHVSESRPPPHGREPVHGGPGRGAPGSCRVLCAPGLPILRVSVRIGHHPSASAERRIQDRLTPLERVFRPYRHNRYPHQEQE
jgi:hypothetical protein